MSLSDIGAKSIGPEELAIVGLMEAIFQLADSGTLFVNRIDKLRSKTTVPGVFPGLNALVPVKEKVSWLVGIIKRHVEKETIQHANAESRQSVSSIIKICTFQLKYLSNRIFVATGSPISQKTAFLSLFGKKKDILERVNFINIQAKDLTRLLDYLNNVRPTPRPGPSISNPPTSLVPRVPCNDFVGRDKMLEALQRKMNTTGQVALDGPPGIGKSEICLQYARKLQDKALMKWIFWIDGKDPTGSFATIARYLGLDLSNQESPANAVLQWITKSKDESLIIVDDVDDVDSTEQSYYTSKRLLAALNESPSEVSKRNISKAFGFAVTTLSPLQLKSIYPLGTMEITPRNRRGNLLISSKALIAQNNTMEKKNLPVDRVPSLHVSEATKLLKELIPKPLLSSDSDYDDIRKLVGCLPGHLKHAAKYIEDTGITTAQYISGYKTHQTLESKNCHTSTSSDDDIQIAAIRISKTFSNNEMFRSLLKILRSVHLKNDQIIKSIDVQLLQYSSDLERIWSERTAQGIEPENTLPAFIKEHHKRLSCLIVPRDPVEPTDCFSFAPRRLSSINSSDSGVSLRSSFSLRGLTERNSRQNSISEQEKQMLASKVTLTEMVRNATTDESKNLERFYFDEEIFGWFLINVLHDLDTIHQIENDPPLFHQAGPISELASLATKAWRSSRGTTTVTYNVEWELLQVLDRDFSPEQHLSTIIAISGNADLAEAISCGEYISTFWKHGAHLLDALSGPKCQWGRYESTKINDSIKVHIFETESLPDKPHTLKVTVEGPEEVQSDIAQTLAWLAAAVRSSNLTKLHESRASMEFYLDDGGLNCEVKSLPLTPLVNFCKYSSCWHALFTNSVIAIDYPPSKPRGSGKGLDISVELLIALARTTIITELYKGFIIQGYQFILIPVKELITERAEASCPNATVQWHLIDTRSSDVSSASLPNKVDSRVRSVAKNDETLRSFIGPGNRAFLGWCGKINIHVGTDTRTVQNGAVKLQAPVTDGPCGCALPYRDPRQRILQSTARDAGRARTITAVSATASGGGHGATGGAGATLGIGESREAAVVGRFGSLKETLQTRSKENIVLYDTATRRAWMVPYLNVLLHLVHLRERATTPHREHSMINMPFAAQHAGGASSSDGPAWDAIQPYLDLLDTENFNKNRLSRLKAHFTEKELRLKNALRFADHLEYLITVIDAALAKNVAWRSKEMSIFHHSKIYGFEMEELSYAASLGYKEQKLHHTSGGWAKMRRNREQVFFCSGIGDLITPESDCKLCSKCQSVPTNMDYLVAPVSCLSSCQHVRHTHGDDEPSHFKIQIRNSRLYEWKVSEAHFSDPCPHYDSDDAGEVGLHWQYQKTIHLSKSPQKSNLEDFSRYMEGAVIFGRRARSEPLKACGAAIRKWMTGFTKKSKSLDTEVSIDTPSPIQGPNIEKSLSKLPLENELNPLKLRNQSLGSNEDDKIISGESQSRTSSSDSNILTHNLFQKREPPFIPAVPSQPELEHLTPNRMSGQNKNKFTLSTASKSSYEATQATTLSPSVANNDMSRGTTPETPSPREGPGFEPVFKGKRLASGVKDTEKDLTEFGALHDVKG
ncbi:hypothetical protein SBOR_8117 [Sclerotinia borealis F-4128]|uniref:Uncharacterized protein n=1 Tax=Sclerotinia borealis (strain F-4128) TaxID=1432307 RepID=W9C6W9_SCLBF|nr:hypothetical protein SBOR_8117 [Sclerotinia borealis F-4128]